MFKYIACGNPSLPPLIFFHGFLGSKEDWMEMFPFFEEQFYCIAYDLPGHGSTPYSETILLDLKEELESFSKPILIGYSLGGRIALQLQKYAESVIVLSSNLGLATQAEREERLKVDEKWSDKLLHLPFERFLNEWYAQSVFHDLRNKPVFLKSITERRMHQDLLALSQVMLQMSLAKMPVIEKFSCPALFLYGEEDLKYRDLYAKLPKTVAVSGIPNSGHMLHLESPQECAAIILKWLDLYASS